MNSTRGGAAWHFISRLRHRVRNRGLTGHRSGAVWICTEKRRNKKVQSWLQTQYRGWNRSVTETDAWAKSKDFTCSSWRGSDQLERLCFKLCHSTWAPAVQPHLLLQKQKHPASETWAIVSFTLKLPSCSCNNVPNSISERETEASSTAACVPLQTAQTSDQRHNAVDALGNIAPSRHHRQTNPQQTAGRVCSLRRNASSFEGISNSAENELLNFR